MNFVPARIFDDELEAERLEADRLLHAIYTHDELVAAAEVAREEGREEGRAEGEAQARAKSVESATGRTIAALEAVAPAVRELIVEADRHRAVLEGQVTDFVLSVFNRVVPDLMKSQAAARAEAEVQRAVTMALGSAKLALWLPEDADAVVGSDLRRRISEAGFEGRVEIARDPALKPGDVRAEWDNGFMDYSYAEICERIIGALQAAAPARRAAQEAEGQAADE